LQHDLRVYREHGYESYLYTCRKCHGGHRYNIGVVQSHLLDYGQDIHLMRSMVGEEPPGGFFPDHGNCINDRNVFDDGKPGIDSQEQLDVFHDIQRQLFDAFDLGDQLRENTVHESGGNNSEEFDFEYVDARFDHVDDLYRQPHDHCMKESMLASFQRQKLLSIWLS
jgi:hypothetical protein